MNDTLLTANNSVESGIFITVIGGIIAGLVLSIANYLIKKLIERSDKDKLYKYLSNNISDVEGKRWVSTRKIASYNKLPEERVRYICSIHKDIVLSIGSNEDMWGLKDISR